MLFEPSALVVTLLISTWLPYCVATCYHPDKTEADSDYQPCFSDRPSMCCATNRNGATNQNKCRPDGLCWESNANGLIYRESCTDPTWTDPACLKLCMDVTTDVPITVCGDGSYCCGSNQESSCCLSGGGFWVASGKVYPYNQNPFKAGAASTSVAPASNTSAADSNPSQAKKPAFAGLGVALGIGLGIGIPLLILLSVFIFLLQRRRSRNHAPADPYMIPPTASHPNSFAPDHSHAPKFAAGHQGSAAGHYGSATDHHGSAPGHHGELASTTPRMELEGDSTLK